MSDSEWITPDGVIIFSHGSGVKRKNNKTIWKLIDRGYKNNEIALALGKHRNTVSRHRVVYGRMKDT